MPYFTHILQYDTQFLCCKRFKTRWTDQHWPKRSTWWVLQGSAVATRWKDLFLKCTYLSERWNSSKIGSNEVKTGMQKCKTTDNKTWLVCSTNLSQRHSCRGRQLKVLRHNRQWCKNINATFYDGGDGGCNVNDGYTVSLCYGNVVLTWATLTQRASWWHITSL